MFGSVPFHDGIFPSEHRAGFLASPTLSYRTIAKHQGVHEMEQAMARFWEATEANALHQIREDVHAFLQRIASEQAHLTGPQLMLYKL